MLSGNCDEPFTTTNNVIPTTKHITANTAKTTTSRSPQLLKTKSFLPVSNQQQDRSIYTETNA
jgi:hypothetical protein